jgi:UDP-3-O-[3-hydroxymyristoyl] glucosamine N-acyltransferase
MSSYYVHPEARVDPASDLCQDTRVAAGCRISGGVHTDVGVEIGAGAWLFKQIRIGNCVKIGPNVVLVGPLVISDDVQIAANAIIGQVVSQNSRLFEGRISRGAVIGSNASVQGLLSIGEYARVEPSARLEGHLLHHGRAAGDPAVLETFVCKCGLEYTLRRLSSEIWECQCSCGRPGIRLGKDALELRGQVLVAS